MHLDWGHFDDAFKRPVKLSKCLGPGDLKKLERHEVGLALGGLWFLHVHPAGLCQ